MLYFWNGQQFSLVSPLNRISLHEQGKRCHCLSTSLHLLQIHCKSNIWQVAACRSQSFRDKQKEYHRLPFLGFIYVQNVTLVTRRRFCSIWSSIVIVIDPASTGWLWDLIILIICAIGGLFSAAPLLKKWVNFWHFVELSSVSVLLFCSKYSLRGMSKLYVFNIQVTNGRECCVVCWLCDDTHFLLAVLWVHSFEYVCPSAIVYSFKF